MDNLVPLFILIDKLSLKSRADIQLTTITYNTVLCAINISVYYITDGDFVEFNFHFLLYPFYGLKFLHKSLLVFPLSSTRLQHLESYNFLRLQQYNFLF